MNQKEKFHLEETLKHKKEVSKFLNVITNALNVRSRRHDDSKLETLEFDIFAENLSKLKGLTYGSKKYKDALKEMEPCITHHHENNRHHPEYFEGGIKHMNLIDIIEMFCDWWAATKRHADGDIMESVRINKERFNFSDDLKCIFQNTVNDIRFFN